MNINKSLWKQNKYPLSLKEKHNTKYSWFFFGGRVAFSLEKMLKYTDTQNYDNFLFLDDCDRKMLKYCSLISALRTHFRRNSLVFKSPKMT